MSNNMSRESYIGQRQKTESKHHCGRRLKARWHSNKTQGSPTESWFTLQSLLVRSLLLFSQLHWIVLRFSFTLRYRNNNWYLKAWVNASTTRSLAEMICDVECRQTIICTWHSILLRTAMVTVSAMCFYNLYRWVSAVLVILSVVNGLFT
jgi:hypothetical protein